MAEVPAPPRAARHRTPTPAIPTAAAGRIRRFCVGSAGVVAFLLVWELAPRLGVVDSIFLPPASRVAQALADLAGTGELWEHFAASLARSLTGFVIATLVAVPLGILVGWYRPVHAALNPLLELFRNTAALALLPVFVLLLGLGELSKVSLVVFACTWPILLNTVSAVRTVDPLLIKSARSLGFSPAALFGKVVLPASVPTIFTGIRLAGASSILVLIAAEMVGAEAGLGYLINASQHSFLVPEMYAGIVTISLLGVALNQMLVLTERRLSRWRAP